MRTHPRIPLQLFVVAFLAFQLFAPLGGLFRSKQATRGNFSWNMYADSYRCSILYTLREPDGRIRTIDHRSYFRNRASSMRVFHRDVLPAFHAWLCQEQTGRLEALVSCSENGGPWLDLVDPAVDLCAPAERGID